MDNQNYEVYLILSPEVSSDKTEAFISDFKDYISSTLEAENVDCKIEGTKKLAYPIKKHLSGIYILFTYTSKLDKICKTQQLEKKMVLNSQILRFLIINQTDFLKRKAKEDSREAEIETHLQLNKGKKIGKKQCISSYLGLKEIDYKDVEFLSQFTSPYAKIFSRKKTGTSAKFQRKISKAIKRARHMALMPFTPRYMD